MTASFQKLATTTASTKRTPAVDVGTGLRSGPVTNLTGLKVLPLMPLDPELARRLGLDTPLERLQTYVEGAPDIVEGDVLVVGAKEYPIVAVADWPYQSDKCLLLVLEELKR